MSRNTCSKAKSIASLTPAESPGLSDSQPLAPTGQRANKRALDVHDANDMPRKKV